MTYLNFVIADTLLFFMSIAWDFKEHISSAKRDHPFKKCLLLPMTTVRSSVRDQLPGVCYPDNLQ